MDSRVVRLALSASVVVMAVESVVFPVIAATTGKALMVTTVDNVLQRSV